MAVRERVRDHRLREQGLRPVQLWVPDVRSDAFAEQAARQSAAVAAADRADDTQELIEATSVDRGEE